MTNTATIKPRFQSIPLRDGLLWRPDPQLRFEQKIDGCLRTVTIQNTTVVGEAVGSKFYAFDVLDYAGEDLRVRPLRERLALLDDLGCGTLAGAFLRPAVGQGGEFLEAVLANGGEGVVAKPLDGLWGAIWFKCKRLQVFYCTVTDKRADGRSAVRLSVLADGDYAAREGSDGGWMALRGSKFDQVRVGSVLKVEAFGRHTSGLLREARPDKDAPGSWLLA